MTDSAPTPAPATDPVRCRGCTYSLAGLAADVLCPECSLPVRESLGPFQLASADAGYRRRLRRGATCIVWAIPVLLAAILTSVIAAELDGKPRGLQVTLDVFVVLIFAVIVLSHLLYTTSERHEAPENTPPRSRRVIHFTVLGLSITIAAQLVLMALWQRILSGAYDWIQTWSIVTMANWTLMMIGLAVLMTATSGYTRWLSARLSDARGVRLAQRSRQLMPFLILPFIGWSIVAMIISVRGAPAPDFMMLIGVIGFVCAIAVLTSIIIYWILLLRVPGRIRRCALSAAKPRDTNISGSPSPRE